MCTVIYLPARAPLFLSNRDESPQRARAKVPAIYANRDVSYCAPIDPSGGGTWIGVNDKKEVFILLNGAFEKHAHRPPYAKSRGLIVSELLCTDMPVITWNLMDMSLIEPYTLIVYTEAMLFELVWDGNEKHRINHDVQKPHIWSSSTLYPPHIKAQRQALFQEWLANHQSYDKASLQGFIHSWADDTNGFVMNRNNIVRTLSSSIIELTDSKAIFDFETIDGIDKTQVALPYKALTAS